MPGSSTVTNAAAAAVPAAGAFTQPFDAAPCHRGRCHHADRRNATTWNRMRRSCPGTVPVTEGTVPPVTIGDRDCPLSPRPLPEVSSGGADGRGRGRIVITRDEPRTLAVAERVARRMSADATRPAAAACPAPPPAAARAELPADRKYLLERVDDAAVAQLYADGFESLPLKEKTLIWIYSPIGRDIFLPEASQCARDAADPRADHRHPQGIDQATLAEISATRSCSGSTTVRTTT